MDILGHETGLYNSHSQNIRVLVQYTKDYLPDAKNTPGNSRVLDPCSESN